MRVLVAALLVTLAAGAAHAQGYARDGRTCDGYPRAPIDTVAGICAGLVLAPPPAGLPPSKRTLHLPRILLPLKGGDVLVVDLGTWAAGRGSVWRLTPTTGHEPGLKRLLTGLDLPHTLAAGPDGRIYLGEMSRIRRFDPDADNPQASLETIVEGLPDNRLHENRHPLSSFIFDADGSLLVNVGAPSDQCPPKPGRARCAEAEGEHPQGAIWRYAYEGAGRWSTTPTTFARGLRNSLALVRTDAGTILQAENSIDVPSPNWPTEELNLITAGGDYGWPYCVGAGEPTPAWRARKIACSAYRNPAAPLPAHSAPLAMVQYHGAMFPQLEGQILVSLHGHRPTGSRLLAVRMDKAGNPTGKPRNLTPGWLAVKGKRPAGAPVGIAVAADGAIWVAEDRTGAILRFARDRVSTAAP